VRPARDSDDPSLPALWKSFKVELQLPDCEKFCGSKWMFQIKTLHFRFNRLKRSIQQIYSGVTTLGGDLQVGVPAHFIKFTQILLRRGNP
jgi:hypothetical protein